MIKKEIAFIYMDSAEKSMMEPLAREAQKRGYKTKITNNKYEKCEIGVYCQHINHPQYSKISVIMLHDIIQQYGNWPDIWFREPWNKYDIGILPSKQWVDNWNQCSHLFYARPKIGMFKVGWPKADTVNYILQKTDRNALIRQYNLDPNKKTVLYAPSWENDGKQNDFVEAMLPLNVNILIKQWDAPKEKFPETVDNINKMYELHKDIPGVFILHPSTNIFKALAIADVLVSEESSTMCEATMIGIPAVSVSDWLIPDVKPSRFPKCDYDFVTCTKKNELQNCIKNLLDNYDEVKDQTLKFSKNNFPNIGCTSKLIIDIIDDVANKRTVRYKALVGKEKKRISLTQYSRHKLLALRNEFSDNYAIRNKFVRVIWKSFSRIYRKLKG